MSTELAGDTVSVAFVVDSSLALAAEWSRVLMDYVAHLLRRLTETNSSHKVMPIMLATPRLPLNVYLQFRLAFITYGLRDMLPSPLLCKNFFSDIQAVTRVIKEEPNKLGIGQTSSGGTTGMAALDGLVAAIEVRSSCLHVACSQLHKFIRCSTCSGPSFSPRTRLDPTLATYFTLLRLNRMTLNVHSGMILPYWMM